MKKCRFLSYVDKQESCWIWTGYKDKKGYGQLCFGGKKKAIASRVSYELFKGPIDQGKLVCHTCDVSSCVNPDHLWMGSHLENMIDMVEKERQHSKLSIIDVINIRKMWKQGCTQNKIIELFKIANGTLSNIVRGRNWRHTYEG